MFTARKLVTTAATVLAATVWVATTDTLGGFPAAVVKNSVTNVASGQLSITNTYGGNTCTATPTDPTPTACTGSALPATVPSTGTGTQATSVRNSGTFAAASITARYRVGGCGPVQLANPITPARAMLPRTGTTFSPTGGPMTSSGSITFNGSTGYASSVAATTEPYGSGAFVRYGLGIWFKTTSTSVSPLFGFADNALTTIGTNYDRILYLNATGGIVFMASSGTSTTATGTYNNGVWHFAYVTLAVNSFFSTTATVFVDGTQVAVSSAFGTLSSYSGYWHLGWSPVGGVSRFFAGSLSDFIVDDGGSAPSTPGTNPTSYTSFDSTRTDQWYLNDSGGAFDGTTTSGVLPAASTLPSSAADPCTYVDIGEALTNPSATALAQQTLRAAVTASWQTVNANPAPAATQTATITLQRHGTVNAYVVGLILYVPLESDYAVGTARAWTVAFRWSAPAAGASAGTTVVIG